MITTEELYNNLKHCIGRDTVEVINQGGYQIVTHYGAPILYYNYIDKIVILNKPFYDYSSATSRVRNAAIDLINADITHTTKKLQKYENRSFISQFKHTGAVIETIKFDRVGYLNDDDIGYLDTIAKILKECKYKDKEKFEKYAEYLTGEKRLRCNK